MGNDLTVDFRMGGNGTDHRGTGWAEPERDGTWMLGQQSLLVLPRPETRGDYRLELDLGALTGPGHPSQRLAVGVNGTVLAEFVLLGEGVEHCTLPWSVIGREPGLTLVLSHPDAWRPSELTGGEGDQREISAFLRTAKLSMHEAVAAASPDAKPPVAAAPARPATPSPAVVAPEPPASVASKPPAPTPAAPMPAAPTPAATAAAARQSAPAQATPLPAVTSLPPPAASPSLRPASTAAAVARPAAPAQEARVPWWKKLLG